MALADCCANQHVQWTQTRVRDRWSDLLVCTSCKHVHTMESQLAPIAWPGAQGCVNCGGARVDDPQKGPRCEKCGLSPDKDRALHDHLVAAHPGKDFLAGAHVAAELGRHVLALKLATAATRWGPPHAHDEARRVRIDALFRVAGVDRALDEVYEWANHGGAPPVVWGQIAAIEIETGNLEAATHALKYGVQVDPLNPDMWANYAEVLLVREDYARAVDAGRRTMEFPEYAERGVEVLVAAAEALYAENKPHDAKVAATIVGPRLETIPRLTWLLARLAAHEADRDQAVVWLEKTLALEPDHAEAKAALLQLKPPPAPKKAGWLPW